jgi:hypothetical protein
MVADKSNNKTLDQYESALDRLHARCRKKKISASLVWLARSAVRGPQSTSP